MRTLPRLVAPLAAALVIAACGAPPAVTLADKSLMPDVVMMQSKKTQEAYRFAVAHPHDLETIPCYCGCNGLGHTNNLQCYLKPESTPDNLIFDEHALACEICADITHLTMDLLESGASPEAIRTAVDGAFAHRGPGTDTPHPATDHTSSLPSHTCRHNILTRLPKVPCKEKNHVPHLPSTPLPGSASRYERLLSPGKLVLFAGLFVAVVVIALVVTVSGSDPYVPAFQGGRAEISQTLFDYGDVKNNTQVKSSFTITNVGDQQLYFPIEPQVSVVEGCCPPITQIDRSELDPGETATVSLSFSMHEGMDGPHDFRVKVLSNDKLEPEQEVVVRSNWIP